MTIKHARGIVNSLGLVLRVEPDREYMVKFRDDHDCRTAYYTNDLQDAVDTAKAMAQEMSKAICKMMVRAG